MAKVFIMQESRFDYSSAEEFGAVSFVTTLEYSPVPNSGINEKIKEDIRRLLNDYQPGLDYLVPTGSPAMISLVMLSLGVKFPHATHKLLKWNNQTHTYQLYKEVKGIS